MVEGVVQNMVTPIELIQAVIGGMQTRGYGRIVNMASVSGIMGNRGAWHHR